MIGSLQVCSQTARGILRETGSVCTALSSSPSHSRGQTHEHASVTLLTACSAPPAPSTDPSPRRAKPDPGTSQRAGRKGWGEWEGDGSEGGCPGRWVGRDSGRAGLGCNAPRYKRRGRAAEREERRGRGGRAQRDLSSAARRRARADGAESPARRRARAAGLRQCTASAEPGKRGPATAVRETPAGRALPGPGGQEGGYGCG